MPWGLLPRPFSRAILGNGEKYKSQLGISLPLERGKKEGQCLRTAPPIRHMILPIKITISELSKNGKAYKWDKCDCQDCHRDMWGHGYVARYFSSITTEIYLKRYRCPSCLTVVTVRPAGYWPRIRSSIRPNFSDFLKRCNSKHLFFFP